MFKKPKRNFRNRRAQENDSDDEKEENTSFGLKIDNEDSVSSFGKHIPGLELAANKKIQKAKKKKEKEKGTGVLSFEQEEEEVEVFKVKKSSHSRRIAKQLKKESKKEREERLKQEANVKESASHVDSKFQSEEDGRPNGNTFQKEESRLSGSESSGDEDGKGHKFGGRHFLSVLQSGVIPDANMIHLARKKRQLAREQQDFIPIDNNVKPEKTSSSRLIRDDDNDVSDEENEGKMSFTVDTREDELRKMQDRILEAEHGSHSEGSDQEQERQWEEQQIRKGTSIPQVLESAKPSDLFALQQHLAYSNSAPGSTSSLSNLGTGVMDMEICESNGSSIPHPGAGTLAGKPPTDTPLLTVEQIKKQLQERCDSMSSVHRVHIHERDDMDSRVETSQANIVEYDGKKAGLEEQYKFYQEMRGYVRDLVECLNEKLPQILYLERCMNQILRQRTGRIIKRRQEDIKDQAKQFSSNKAAGAPNLMSGTPEDIEKQRRAAEREARRSRRRRAREGRGIRDHYEGMSTDDEDEHSEQAKFSMEIERITSDSRTIFTDVLDEFHRVGHIKRHFEDWRRQDPESYQEAYISLCLPKLFTPIIKRKLIEWNPLDDRGPDFEESDWFESLMFYGYREGHSIDPEDGDVKLMPSIVEKIIVPKLAGMVEEQWDPLSSTQTRRLVQLLKRLIRDYPTVSADSKNAQVLFKAVAERLRKTLDDDVFMPLYPKTVLENRSSGHYNFFQRQFWTCVKLMDNILQFHGILSNTLLKELAIDGILNRYIVLALQFSPVNHESLLKCQFLTSSLPKSWFSELETDSTLPQLENLCRYLLHAAKTFSEMLSKDIEAREAREGIKQVTKLLVSIHAMDHAVSLADRYSL